MLSVLQMRAMRAAFEKAAEEPQEIPSARSYADLQKRLKPGDILVSSLAPRVGGSFRSGPVSFLAESAYRKVHKAWQGENAHASLYAGRGKVVDITRTSGIRKIPLRRALKHVDVKILRPQVTTKQRKAALDRVKGILNRGATYDVAALPRTIAASFVKTKGDPLKARLRQNKLICSTLVAKAYGRTRFSDKDKELLMPHDFVTSDKTRPIALFKNPGRKDRRQ